MKNPGLYAAFARGQAGRRAEQACEPDRQAKLGQGGRIIAAGLGATGRSGRVHRGHDLSHRRGVTLEEPKQALQVDHRTDPMVLQALFHAPEVAGAP